MNGELKYKNALKNYDKMKVTLLLLWLSYLCICFGNRHRNGIRYIYTEISTTCNCCLGFRLVNREWEEILDLQANKSEEKKSKRKDISVNKIWKRESNLISITL